MRRLNDSDGAMRAVLPPMHDGVSPRDAEAAVTQIQAEVAGVPLLSQGQHEAVDAVLEQRGLRSIEILLLAGFGWVSDGAETIVLSYMVPALEDIWGLSHAQQGAMMTAVSFGQAVGAAFWGALADRRGRRPAFLLSLLFTFGFGFASSAATGFASLCALRLATGFAIGGNLPLAVSVATELLPPSWRERGVVALQLFNEIGSLASTGLAAVLLPDHWRLYLLAVAVPAVSVFGVALFRLPESPHWLISCGKHADAAAVLHRLAGGGTGLCSVSLTGLPRQASTALHLPAPSPAAAQDCEGVRCDGVEDNTFTTPHHTDAPATDAGLTWHHDPPCHDPPCHDPPSCGEGSGRGDSSLDPSLDYSLDPSQSVHLVHRSGRSGCGAGCVDGLRSEGRAALGLCTGRLWRTTFLLCVFWFSANFASGWWTWMPEFAKLQGLRPDVMYESAAVARFVAMGSFLLAAAIIGRVGAWPLLLVALATTGALSFALSFVIDDPSLLASDAFIGVYAVFALFFGTVWPVMYVVTPAAFPSDARGAGFGFVSSWSKLGALTQPNVVARLLPPSPLPPPPALPGNATLPLPPSAPAPALPAGAGHAPVFYIGLVFTAAWGVAFTAALAQALRSKCSTSIDSDAPRLLKGSEVHGADERSQVAPAASAAPDGSASGT